MQILRKIVFFLLINFGGLAFGSWLMNNGPTADWYQNLSKAPWTPPGWVFGVAWTIIMICFSIYLVYLFSQSNTSKALRLFIFQLILNVSWNYIFFNQQLFTLALVSIVLLTIVVFTFFYVFNSKKMKYLRLLLLPYMIWLCIATSLNAYIVLYN